VREEDGRGEEKTKGGGGKIEKGMREKKTGKEKKGKVTKGSKGGERKHATIYLEVRIC